MSKTEKISLVLSAFSIVIALAATAFSILAWQRPIPADPREIPAIGSVEEPHIIDGGDGGKRFFDFLDENAGRKVRIVAILDTESVRIFPDENANTANEITVDSPDSDGMQDALLIENTGNEILGLWYDTGTWRMNGYFADAGIVSARQGLLHRSITAIDIVTAVN